ncbi:MAG: glycosyltransferase family 1 protein [Candidatus Dadabacteria bacterium]|nr:MAG: glycosyltransferase family 1 protein [Candidatus Dadabacteria bacterium]
MSILLNKADQSFDKAVAPPLRVLIDGRMLGTSGLGIYTENLIRGLLSSAEVNITVLLRSDDFNEYDWAGSVQFLRDSARLYSYDELFKLGLRIDQSQFDLYHYPHYTLPFNIRIPAVITVHDLIHITHPERRYYPLLSKAILRSALKRASRIISVSQSTVDQIARFTGSNQRIMNKVRLVPNVIDPYFLSEQNAGTQRQAVKGKYLLSIVSNTKPHKGINDLLDAFDLFLDKLSLLAAQDNRYKSFLDLKLVLAGAGARELVELEKLLNKVGSIKRVCVLGQVRRSELKALYKGAMALVVPSLAEGFCLPVLEAQSQGTPVIARPVPAVCELLTAHDIGCEDFSITKLCEAMIMFVKRVIESPDTDIHKVNREHLRCFDRDALARVVCDVYREARGEQK